MFLLLKNVCTFLLAKEKTCKRIFNTNSELSQNHTEKQIMVLETKQIGSLMIYDVIYSLLILIETMAFFKKQFQEFIISLNLQEKNCILNSVKIKILERLPKCCISF